MSDNSTEEGASCERGTQELAAELLRRGLVDEVMQEAERQQMVAAETDVHFLLGTPEDLIHQHLRDAHGDRAPWGNAFSDERPGERPARIYSVHAWCHREDGTTDHPAAPCTEPTAPSS